MKHKKAEKNISFLEVDNFKPFLRNNLIVQRLSYVLKFAFFQKNVQFLHVGELMSESNLSQSSSCHLHKYS